MNLCFLCTFFFIFPLHISVSILYYIDCMEFYRLSNIHLIKKGSLTEIKATSICLNIYEEVKLPQFINSATFRMGYMPCKTTQPPPLYKHQVALSLASVPTIPVLVCTPKKCTSSACISISSYRHKTEVALDSRKLEDEQ